MHHTQDHMDHIHETINLDKELDCFLLFSHNEKADFLFSVEYKTRYLLLRLRLCTQVGMP